VAQEVSDDFSGGLRGSIGVANGSSLRTTDNLDLSTDAGQRAQLGAGQSDAGQENQARTGAPQAQAVRAPIPLSPRTQQRAQPVQAEPIVFNPESVDQSPRDNLAAEPVQSGTTVVEEEDPFAATGFRLGIFEGDLSLEQSVGYSSNISRNVDGEGGAFSQTDVNLGLVSDWSRHELQINLNGSYRRPFDSDEIDQPFFSGTTALRLDLLDGVTLTTSGFYTAQTQSFTSTTLAPGAVDTPLFENYGGAIELQRADRKLQFTLRGEIDRDIYESASLGGGVTVSQSDLNNTQYGASLRVGYEVSPAITPFVEGGYAIREFDETLDRNGDRRDSNLINLRGGIEFDLGDKMQGEVAVGYVTEQFEDPSLADLRGVTFDGELNWSPERDTQLTLTLGTQTNSSINAGENGSIIYNAQIAAERQINHRWSVNGLLGFQRETNDENNTTLEVGVGIEYWVNRFMAMTGDLEYNSFSSDAADADFDEVSARIGVRLQR
jgi:hypothetical protein